MVIYSYNYLKLKVVHSWIYLGSFWRAIFLPLLINLFIYHINNLSEKLMSILRHQWQLNLDYNNWHKYVIYKDLSRSCLPTCPSNFNKHIAANIALYKEHQHISFTNLKVLNMELVEKNKRWSVLYLKILQSLWELLAILCVYSDMKCIVWSAVYTYYLGHCK